MYYVLAWCKEAAVKPLKEEDNLDLNNKSWKTGVKGAIKDCAVLH